MAAAFTIFEKFGDVCAALNEDDRKELCYAICMYGMFGEEVELPYLLKAIFISLKEDIDNSKESRLRGSKGGRPRMKREVSEDEKPGVSETSKPQVSENEKPHVSEEAAKTESQTKPTQTKPSQTKGGRRFAPPSRDDVAEFSRTMERDFARLGNKYYLSLSSEPRVRVTRDRITVTFDIDKGE